VNTTRVVVCALVALPVGWFAGILVDRVPDRLPLFADLAGVRWHGKYLALHLLIVALYVAAALRFEDASVIRLVTYLVVFASLATLSVIDLELLRLPDRIVVPTFLITLALVVLGSVQANDAGLIQFALAGAGMYFGVLLVFHLISPRAMGFGDVKMAAVLGLAIGWLCVDFTQVMVLTLWAMIIGFVLGAVVGMGLFIARKRSKAYPFGPFLAVGTVVAVLASNPLLNP
jgi:leader peptidase (prepilin peptidase)/N-methyltransferase